MKRILLPLLIAFTVAACSSESSLPNPTGKGTLRAINAISTSPDIFFLIEERSLGGVAYKNLTTPVPFDDFDYVFNFEVALAGDVQPSRVASRSLKVEADIEYTFIITGAVDNPTITITETPIRSFDEGTTVFELRLAHLAEGFPTVDIYVAPEGTVPVLGEQLTTLSFGQIMPPMDVGEGDYVVTITAAGDPGAVVFQSGPVTFGAGNALFVAAFAPDANDIDPLSVRGFTSGGALAIVADADSESTVRFVNAALDLGPVDIYNDDDLNSQLAANLAFQAATGDIPVALGLNELNVTPAGSTATLLVESDFTVGLGTRSNSFITGSGGSYIATTYTPDRRSVETLAKARLFNASRNSEFVDLYVLEAGSELTDTSLARAAGIVTGTPSAQANILDAGNYDVYVTSFGESTPIAGPFNIDIALGDVIEFVVYDTVDPNVGEIAVLPAP